MERIWLKHYPKQVPAEINVDAYSSLVELFEESSTKFANKPAYYNLGTTIYYSKLQQIVNNVAAFFQQKLNIKKGDRVAIMLPNVLQYPVSLFAVLKIGAVVVNVNPLYTASELEKQLKDSGATTIIVLENFAKTLQAVHQNTKIENIIIAKIGDLLKFPMNVAANFLVKIKGLVPQYDFNNHLNFADILKQGEKLQLEVVSINSEDLAFLQYTGGTTGIAKGAMLSHRNIISNIEQAHAWVKPKLEQEQQIIITALPLYHIFSLTANCFLFLRLGGLNVLISNPRDINAFIKDLEKFKFTCITGVNTLFNLLLRHERFKELDFSNLTLALGGGMAIHKETAINWQKTTGKNLYQAYGLTETSPAVCIEPLDVHNFSGSIGMPISSTEISIRDDNGNELGCNQEGELWVKGPQVMQGYWQQPQETSKVLTTDDWFKTGDVAVVDDKGFVKIVERKKDLIIVSGFNVYPNEVEEVIASHASVKEVAVIGVPDIEKGEKVKAFVVQKGNGLNAEDIINHCRERLTGYKVPHEVEFRDDLPKSNVGKVLRRALKE